MFAQIGAQMALGEITLVLFTTLAPAGAFAFMIMAVYLLAQRRDGKAAAPDRAGEGSAVLRRTEIYLVIPIVVTMVGLVASATHLGNPANALYVFAGIGRSPLSNEVAAAVVFLALAGVYWLYSFSLKPSAALQRVWLALAVLAGAVFITAVAFAYDAETIASWHTPFVPMTIWANAAAGGPLLALFALQAAGVDVAAGRVRLARVLGALSLVASLACDALYLAHGEALLSITSALASPYELDPYYGFQAGLFACLSLVASIFTLRSASRKKPTSLRLRAVLCILMFIGIFIMRFAFYATHMTV